VWPYAALAIFVVGAVASAFVRHRNDRHSSASADGWAFLRVSKVWPLSLLVLILGHLAGLVFPHEILLWNAAPARLYVLEGAAFAAGLAALGWWASMMWRHLNRSFGSVASELADTIFLSLLFAVLVSGVATAVLHRWGSSWSVLTVTPYAISVFRGRPYIALAEQMPLPLQFHIFCAFASTAMLPLTSLAPRSIYAVRRKCEPIFASMLGAVQQTRTVLVAWIEKQSRLKWIWPEED